MKSYGRFPRPNRVRVPSRATIRTRTWPVHARKMIRANHQVPALRWNRRRSIQAIQAVPPSPVDLARATGQILRILPLLLPQQIRRDQNRRSRPNNLSRPSRLAPSRHRTDQVPATDRVAIPATIRVTALATILGMDRVTIPVIDRVTAPATIPALLHDRQATDRQCAQGGSAFCWLWGC